MHRASKHKKVRSSKTFPREVEETTRPWELMFAPDCRGEIGMVWINRPPCYTRMKRNPKYKDGVSSWRLRQLRELGIQLHKENTPQFAALIAEIANRKATGTWELDKYEQGAAA